jgi:hypothetical protein
VSGCCEHDEEPFGHHKIRGYPDQLGDCWIFKIECAKSHYYYYYYSSSSSGSGGGSSSTIAWEENRNS